jgi:uncharacterized protein (TIGR02246 family)
MENIVRRAGPMGPKEVNRMRYATWIGGAALALVLATGVLSGRPSHADEDEAMAVRKQCNLFVTAWNKHDAAAMAAIFADEGDMISDDGQRHEGREAVKAVLAAWHGAEGPMRASTVKVLDEPVRFVTDEVAVSDATVSVSGVKGEGEATMTVPLHVTNVWKKTDGKWMLFASRPFMKHSGGGDK